MSTSHPTDTNQSNGDLKKNESTVPVKDSLDSILEKLETIDLKITTLNDCHAESVQLLNRLKIIEANFAVLFRVSRSEIARLKSEMHPNPSHSTSNRNIEDPKVDPLKPISEEDITSLLHYSSNISSTTNSRRSSPLTHLASNASSTANSSPLASDFSSYQSPDQNRRHPENLVQNISHDPTSVIPADEPVESRLLKKCDIVETKDASTGLPNGTEGHVLRLFSASVRNARDHHAYSVMNAPPTRGHILDAKEKAELDKYYDDMEAKVVKSLLSRPEDDDGIGGDEKMDTEEITEEESGADNFDERRSTHRNHSPHIDVDEHVSDIDSHKSYEHGNHEEAISEGEIYDDLDDDTVARDSSRNRGERNRSRVHSRASTPRTYHKDDRTPKNPRYESSGRRNRYETPVSGHRTLTSSSSSGHRTLNSHSSTEYYRSRPAKRPRRYEENESYNPSPPQRRRLPPSSGRNSSPRNTGNRNRGHVENSRGLKRQRTPSPRVYATSSFSNRHHHHNRSYKQRR